MEESEVTTLIKDIQPEEEYKLYTKRWLILALFVLTLGVSLIQMQQYVAISDSIVKYYNISIVEVNWSELVYFVELIVLIFPSIFIIEKLGLRKTVLICAVGTAIGAWIKVAGVSPNRFWVIILGQGVNGIFCSVLTLVPPKVAAKWFGSKEVSSACSVGVLATPAALAFGFLIPTSAIHPKNVETFERSLFIVNIVYAAVPTVLIPLLWFFFDDTPLTSPSQSQFLIQNEINPSQNLTTSIKKFVTNLSFMCVTVMYYINASFYYTITTLLNPIMLKYYPNSTAAIGYVGFTINIAGIFGTILTGILLDKFGKYKLTAWSSAILGLLSSIAFIFFLDKGLNLAYFLAGLYGFFMYTFVLVVIEVGIEVTYPEPEIMVFGFFAVGAQSCGIGFTYLCTYLLNNCGELTLNLVFTGILIVGNAALIFVKYDLKRQAAVR